MSVIKTNMCARVCKRGSGGRPRGHSHASDAAGVGQAAHQECPERYPYDVTGVAWRNPDDVTTGPKIGKSTWPRLESKLKGIYKHFQRSNKSNWYISRQV